MLELWTKIESFLKRIAPEIVEELASPATNGILNQLQESIGTQKSGLIESLKIHDGQQFGYHSFVNPWRLMPTKEIIEHSERLIALFPASKFPDGSEARGPVKPVVWSTAWFPFAADDTGNFLCADFAPDTGGQVEQIILWAADPPYVEVIASSYHAWLEQFATDLEAGKFVWDAEDVSWSRIENR